MPKMTKSNFETLFREEVLPYVIERYEQDGIPDKPARREAWNDTVDAYIRDQMLPEAAGNWAHPRWLETWRPARHHLTMKTNGESYASIHRQAVRESSRALLNRELTKIWDATHVAVLGSKIYAYGSAAEARDFAKGLRGVEVRPITVREQNDLARHKRQVFGNP